MDWGWSYCWFVLKAWVLAIPFLILGFFLAPSLPAINPMMAIGFLAIVTLLGFFLMVVEDDEYPARTQKMLLCVKVGFFIACVCVSASGFKLDKATSHFFYILSIPLYLITAKIFFDVDILSFFDDD
jgi:hypothetical protein